MDSKIVVSITIILSEDGDMLVSGKRMKELRRLLDENGFELIN